MKIKNNGVEKDITVLKHFKINEDEYIIFKEVSRVGLGVISDNKITTPSSEQMGVAKTIIANLISSNYNDNVNQQNNCTILNNDLDEGIEEVSSQAIKFTDSQLSNLTNEIIIHKEEEHIKNSNSKIIPLLIVIIVLLILAIAYVLFQDKIFKSKTNEPKQEEKTTNKEVTKEATPTYKKDVSIETLLERETESIYKADVNMYLSIFPKFLQSDVAKKINKEELTKKYDELKKEYGEDAKMTYTITKKTKMNDDWIKDSNEFYSKKYKTDIKLIECYELEGTLTKSGTLKTDVNDNPFSEKWFCKFSDESTGLIYG